MAAAPKRPEKARHQGYHLVKGVVIERTSEEAAEMLNVVECTGMLMN